MGVAGLFDFARQLCDHLPVVVGDFVVCSLSADGARFFFEISIGSVVAYHPILRGMAWLFVGGVGCPPGWWVKELCPSHGGEVLSRGGGGALPGAEKPTGAQMVHKLHVRWSQSQSQAWWPV